MLGQDLDSTALEKGIKFIEWSVDNLVSKGGVNKAKEEILGRIRTTTDLSDGKEADIVIEAVIENLELKRKLFSDLETEHQEN